MSRWVQGAYAPVEQEVDCVDLEVDGVIPPELNGMLARIGPNPIGEVGEDHQLFLGDGMIHSLTLEGGRAVSYRNRWVRTEPVAGKLGEEPKDAPIDHLDCANTHIFPFAGSLYALTETSIPYAVSSDLDTEGRADFDGFIDTGFTAHPHVDPRTGQMHAIGYDVSPDKAATHFVFAADGSPLRKNVLELGGSSWIHDFAASEHFMIVWDLPLQYNTEMAAAGAQIPFRWTPGYEARVGLRRLDAEDASVLWFDGPQAFVFHPVNAWEETDASGKIIKVVCDTCRYPKMYDQVRTGPGDMAPPQLYRWTFDLTTGQMTEEQIDPRAQEFARIDDRFWGQKHNFAVTTELFRFTGETGIIAHYDDAEPQAWSMGKGVVTSEAVFVPESDTAAQGEGYVLAAATDAQSGASRVSIFDSQKVAKGPLAEVLLPVKMPVTFHGSWLPAVK
ncbi:MAG: carotenoid oxygenase family protein [Pseudomonadota bacterium]